MAQFTPADLSKVQAAFPDDVPTLYMGPEALEKPDHLTGIDRLVVPAMLPHRQLMIFERGKEGFAFKQALPTQ